MALERLAPYSRAIVVDGFAGPERFVATSDGDSTSAYGEGAFSCIFQNRARLRLPLSEADDPLAGQDFAALLRIDEKRRRHGDDRNADGSSRGQWVFAVDPTRQTWEVLQFDTRARGSSRGPGPMPTGRR